MLMKRWFSLSVILPVVLFSCAPSPVWENPISPIKQTDPRLSGAWGQSDYPSIFIGTPVDGWMSFVISDRDKSGRKIFGSFYVSQLEGRRFVNVKIRAPWDLSDFYFIAEYRLDSNQNLFVAFPNHDFVKKALEDGRLSGRIEKSDSGGEILILSSDSSEIGAFIRESSKEKLFPESPTDVLRRIR